jgi:outer membrane protein OmpA-like peptidoglycan-associated protein
VKKFQEDLMQKSLIALTMFAVAAAGSSACATKGYVRTQVGQVSSKVDTLTTSLEETQERTKQNETKITAVDEKAGAAGTAADSAGSAARMADQKAVAAGQSADAAATKAAEVDKATKRIVYEVVLNESQGNFKFGDATLPDAAKARIDELVSQIKADPKGAYFEIEGHTDNVGDKAINNKIGLERAEAVKMYLYSQHQIPLHKMNVISYGEDKPAVPNNSRDNRAQNRRVVIRVLI